MQRLVGLAIVLVAAAGCGSGGRPGTRAASVPVSRFAGAELGQPQRAPDLALHDQDGKLVRLSAQRGRFVLVTFLYTRCPDVCPLIAQNLNGALRELRSDGRSVRVFA